MWQSRVEFSTIRFAAVCVCVCLGVQEIGGEALAARLTCCARGIYLHERAAGRATKVRARMCHWLLRLRRLRPTVAAFQFCFGASLLAAAGAQSVKWLSSTRRRLLLRRLRRQCTRAELLRGGRRIGLRVE